MNRDFEKIRENKCTFYIHKQFLNDGLGRSLLAGEEKLRQLYALKTIPSSEYTRVHKFTIRIDGAEREVYLKQYLSGSVLHSIKSLFRGSRAKQDFEATLMLARNGFDVPAVVGVREDGAGLFHRKSFSLTFGVEDSKAIYQFVPENREILSKEQLRSWRGLIRAFGRTVGSMHAKGIFHGDLRLGNVLTRQEKNRWQFFFIDNEQTRRFDRLPFYLQVRNLVQVAMGPGANVTNTDRMRFFKEYWVENGTGKKQKTALIKTVLQRTNQRLSNKKRLWRKLRRCLRTNQRYLRIKASGCLSVFDRSFCGEAEPLDFISQIDAMMDKGQILKNGSTCYVSRLSWNNKDVVVKRYNHMGVIHSLRHTIKRSRARRSWLHAHRLRILQIATPEPLAYVEQRRAMLVWKSYFVTEYVAGQMLYHFLRDNNVTQDKQSKIMQQVRDLLGRLGEYRIAHGDLKHTNILVNDSGVTITDLDGMKAYKSDLLFRFRVKKDLKRFGEVEDVIHTDKAS